MSLNEKDSITPADSSDVELGQSKDVGEEFEIFGQGDGDVNFRTVEWVHASMIFLKIIFATGVLSIPSVMYDYGAVPGSILLVSWTGLNGYTAIIQGNFRNQHPGCHSIGDMAQILGGVPLRELAGLLFVASNVVCAASGIIGISAALNALSVHAACTVWWSLIATVAVFFLASVRKFSHISWLTWVGFLTIFVAVLIVVIGVTLNDRPAAAPAGPYELGFRIVGNPAFIPGISASLNMFVSSAATSAFLPVISEMKKPKDYNKAVFLCMGFVTAAYLAFTMVLYYWCGQWIASPSLGSAGPTVKKIAYGVGLPGLLISGCLYVHVASKYLFVRILRNSVHLQRNSFVHWGTWLSCTASLSIVAFILASAIPIFNYILALVGSLCFAPLAISLPGLLWLYDHGHKRRGIYNITMYGIHVFMVVLGLFMTVSGTYSVISQIQEAYAGGQIDSAFSCADNSGTV